jgi:CHASE2 domain-containing sensor protein
MAKASSLMKIIHPFTRKGWGHWLRFALLLTAAGYAGHLLSSSTALTAFRYAIYHRQLMMRDRSQLYPKRTALVLLNDDDYWGDSFQSRTPLKRGQLAELMDKLESAGVNTVAMDVDLRSPLPPTIRTLNSPTTRLRTSNCLPPSAACAVPAATLFWRPRSALATTVMKRCRQSTQAR